MMRIGIAALLLAGLAQAVAAQTADPSAPQPSSPEVAVNTRLDVSRLPIDLDRIQRRLRETQVREERAGLNLRYFVEVFGQAPRIELFTKQDNLQYGPVPYGAPTHKEFIEHITPQEYRAPAADFSALIRWLADRKK